MPRAECKRALPFTPVRALPQNNGRYIETAVLLASETLCSAAPRNSVSLPDAPESSNLQNSCFTAGYASVIAN
jgi:hypothetical protein